MTITVNPKQDTPDVPVVPGPQVVDEDTVLAVAGRSTCLTWTCGAGSTDPNAFDYDPDWTGTVTLAVNYGRCG